MGRGWADNAAGRRIKRRDLIFERTFCGEQDEGKKSAMLTFRAFAKKIKSQSVIRFCVISIWATETRLTFQPNEHSLVDRSLCVQRRHFRSICNCGPMTFIFLGLVMRNLFIYHRCGRGSLQATAAQALGCFQAERQSLTAFVGWARSSTLERRTGAPRRSKSRKSLTRANFIVTPAFRLRHLAF